LVLDAGGCVIGLNILLFFCVQTWRKRISDRIWHCRSWYPTEPK
jgi:hypothetical protein